jgi:hypothetical protein
VIFENINAGFYMKDIFPCDPDILQSEAYGSNAVPKVAVSGNGGICKTQKTHQCRRLLLHQHVLNQGHGR